jgi:YfiH family protein
MPGVTKTRTPSRKTAAARTKAPARTAPWTLRRAAGVQALQAPAKLDWLVHGFSTRTGGASAMRQTAPLQRPSERFAASGHLNLGFTDWDPRDNVIENRRRFFRAIGAEKLSPVLLRQIHSDVIHTIDARSAAGLTQGAPALSGDALITREPGILLAVQTADCLPILLADTKAKAVAAIHSGWRGTLAGIAEKTVGRMRMEFGTRPENLVAAIGPGIGGCCYEVGGEVAQQFEARHPNAREWFDGPFDKLAAGENDPNWLPWLTMRPPGHAPPPLTVNLDLIAANRSILAAAGVPAARIFCSGYCTACRTDLFFSYRRERVTGRLIAAIGILPQ